MMKRKRIIRNAFFEDFLLFFFLLLLKGFLNSKFQIHLKRAPFSLLNSVVFV